MKNPKEFWEGHHEKKTPLWLTGSTLARLCSVHGIAPPKGKIVLEVGVGQGHATRELAKDNLVHAVDISQVALDNLPGHIQKHLTCDMVEIPRFVDLAICHLVLQHCEDDAVEFILKETIRTLKPDGVFVLQSADSKGAKNWADQVQRRELVWRTPERVRQMVADAGGEIMSDRVVKTTHNINWQLLKIAKNI